MAYAPFPGIGSLFSMKRRKKDAADPDFQGFCCTPEGQQLEIVGWKKRAKSGAIFLSLKLSVRAPASGEP